MGMLFDGITNYAGVPNAASLQTLSQMSAFFWVKGSAQQNKLMLSKSSAGAGNRGWMVATDWHNPPYDKLKVIVAADGSFVLKAYVSTKVILDNTWHYVGFGFTDDNLVLYIDGQVAAVTVDTPGVVHTIYNSTEGVGIGCVEPSSPAQYFLGYIHDPRIYNRALSPSEILSVMKSISVPDGLVLHYDFWGPRGADGTGRIRDLSPYGNHGTNFGSKQVPIPDFPPLYKR